MSNKQFSRLMLGTVQFGMNYGVANATGKPSYEQARNMLKCAYDLGVTALDTAPEYGDSEDVIGKALQELGLQDRFSVVSKIPIIPAELKQETEVYAFIRNSVERSLKRLQLQVLDGCLLHSENDLQWVPALKRLEQEGLILHGGLSANTAAFCEPCRNLDFLQVPCSMLDHRFDSLLTADAGQRFIRGAYMQGMLLMPLEKIPFVEVRERREKLQALGIPMAELAMRYLLNYPANVSILTGVERLEQLQENVRVAALPPLEPELMATIRDITANPPLPEELASPYFWPKVKKERHIN